MSVWLRRAGWLVVGTLVAAAVYELALALGAGSLGPEANDGVAGSGFVRAVALIAMIAAAGLALAPSVRPWPAALFAPAAAAFLVTFYFTYDPYYAPQLHRYSGFLPGGVIAVVAAVAVAAGVLTRRFPRYGGAITSLVVLLVFVTTVFAGAGH